MRPLEAEINKATLHLLRLLLTEHLLTHSEMTVDDAILSEWGPSIPIPECPANHRVIVLLGDATIMRPVRAVLSYATGTDVELES